MAITAAQQTTILKIVSGLFNAAPGATYLTGFANYIAGGGTMLGLANALAADAAFTTSIMGGQVTVTAQVAKLMTNFGLTPAASWTAADVAGTANFDADAYFTAAINAGTGFGQIVHDAVTYLELVSAGTIVAPQYAAVATTLTNKAAVAEYYSATLGTSSTTLSTLQSVVSGVTSATVVATTADLAAALAASSGITGGQTFTLTTGADTGASFTGTASGDTFVGTVGTDGLAANGTTLNAGDVLAGGLGTDTLNISISGSASAADVTTAAVTMTGIESISVSNFETHATRNNIIDLSQASGVTGVSLAASAATGDTSFTNVAAIVTAAMGNGAGDLSITYANAAVSGTADAQTLTLSGQTAGAFTVAPTSGSNDIESLAIASNTASNTIAVTSASLTSIAVTGTQNLTLTEGTTTLATVNASALTGNLTLTTNDATTMSITGGTGNDAITINTNFTSADSVDGGLGTDSLTIDVAVASAADLVNVTGIETLKVTGGANVTLAANVVPTRFTVSDAGSSIVTLNTGYTAATTVDLGVTDKVVNTANVALTINATAANMISGADVSITGGTGTDTLNLTADGSAALTLGSITSLNAITIVDGGDDASTGTNPAGDDVSITIGAAYATSLTVDASALDAGTLTGTTMNADWENLNFDATLQSTAATVLNVTGGAGADTIQGGAGNDIIAGGAGNDSINGTAGGADSITAGDGDDTINMVAALTSADTIDGGVGTDTLAVTTLASTGLTNVTNVENLSLSGAASSATLTSNLSFTTIDMSTVDDAAQTLTLSTGYTNATTVSVDAGDKVVNSANVALTVNADAANLQAADITTITGGTGTDTLNITADTDAAAGGFAAVSFANLVTLVDTITIVDGGNDASTGTNPAGDDVSITMGAYATALTIDGSAMSAGTLTGTTMNADWENLVVDGSTATKNLTVTTGSGANTITGGSGNDSITAGSGNDSINGSAGGNDTIITGDGTNTVNMGTGLTYQDTITGGAGTDTLIVSGAVTDVQFMATTLVNTLTLDNTATLASFATAAGITKVNVSGANAVDASGMTSGVTFVATAGGSAVATSVAGGTGNDTFQFDGTSLDSATAVDSLNGGSGTDAVFLNNSAASVVGKLDLDAVTNIETITLGTASGLAATSTETVALTIDALALTTAQTITIDGSVITDSDDTIAITNSAATTTTKFSITGGAGNDTLAGSSAADTISGGDGADSITGGLGADSLTGGAGADSFVYAVDSAFAAVPSGNAAADTITDFVSATDLVAIALNAGATAVNAANVGSAATNADGLALLSSKAGEYFFNTTTKQLVMDVDGNGLLQANDLYVTLTGATALATADVAVTVTGTGAITLGAGADTIDITAANNYTVTGGAGNDTFNATQATLDASDVLTGGADTDTLNIAGTGTTSLTTEANLVTIENITFTSDTHALDITSQTEAFNITFANGTNSVTTTTTAAHSITGGTGADTVTVANQAALAGLASFAGGTGTDVIALTAASIVIVDADFAGFTSVDTLQLGGAANTVVLGANATAASLATVVTGTGATSITSTQTALAVNATGIADGTALTLLGTANYTVTGLQGDLTVDNAHTGNVAATLVAVATSTVAFGSNTTGTHSVNGDALTDGQVLTLTGADVASVSLVGGDLDANAYTGALTVTATTGTNSITGGSGSDNITAGTGADTVFGGVGSDTIVLGAAGDIDQVRYTALTEFSAAGSTATYDTITGFTTTADKILITSAGTLDGAIDDVTANNTIAWLVDAVNGTTSAVNAGTDEAISLTDAAGATTLTDLAAIATLMNTELVITTTGAAGADEFLVVVQSGGSTGMYLYTEAAAAAVNTASAAELQIIGIATGSLLVSGDFTIA